jgi:hypothetical protein
MNIYIKDKMKLDTLFDIYELISSGTQGIPTRKSAFAIRKRGLDSLLNNTFVKVAFDTRRIDQETTYNPRRGLQNYHRSEPFVSANMLEKIKAFSKLSTVLDQIKSEYGREAEWQDSYVRVLSSAVHKGLRTVQADGDYSDAQPSMASLAYLEELMYVRYRLTADSLMSMGEQDLRNAILSKDELLTNGGNFNMSISPVTTSDVSKYSYDNMMEKMLSTVAQVISQMKPQDDLTSKLFDVKATKDSPDIERTVTINIKDKINPTLEKVSETKNDEITIDGNNLNGNE